MSDYAILINKEVLPCDVMQWARWVEKNERVVAKTNLGSVCVSTVFLGLDHRFGEGSPLWFETMVFGGTLDQEMNRYTIWEDAEKGHAVMVDRVEQAERNEAAP